jgi:hypothetical protein
MLPPFHASLEYFGIASSDLNVEPLRHIFVVALDNGAKCENGHQLLEATYLFLTTIQCVWVRKARSRSAGFCGDRMLRFDEQASLSNDR